MITPETCHWVHLNSNFWVFSWSSLYFAFIFGTSWSTGAGGESVWVYSQACISMCASDRVCSLFMARNQLSLAHNGNANSPERFSPTQGGSWLGECCVFPNPNRGKYVDGLKNPAPLFSPSLQQRATPCPYITQTGQPNRSYWQPENVFTHAFAWFSIHTRMLVGSVSRWCCSYYDRWHLLYDFLNKLPQNGDAEFNLNSTFFRLCDDTFSHTWPDYRALRPHAGHTSKCPQGHTKRSDLHATSSDAFRLTASPR